MVTHSDEMANALERTLTLESGRLIEPVITAPAVQA
jgi:hypothetical protein